MSFNRRVSLLIIQNTNKTLCRTSVTEVPGVMKSWKQVPGPFVLPIIGSMFHFLPVVGPIGPIEDTEVSSHKLYKRYGPVVRIEEGFGLTPYILIYDVKLMEHVLLSEDCRIPERPGFPSLEYYRKRYSQHILKEKSSGLLTEHGERWKNFRTVVNPLLLQPNTIKLYRNEINKVAIDMIDRLKSIRNEENMINGDFELEMHKWALESIGVVALGSRIGCLKDLAEGSQASQLIQVMKDAFIMSDKLDNKPSIWRYFETNNLKKAMRVYDKQIELTKIFIKKAMKEYEQRETLPENKGALENLLQVDADIAVAMASDMLFAGVDTTAHTMLGILYLLGSNRNKQDLLRKEILSTGPEDQKPYLGACIKESLRLLPVARDTLRRATKDYNLYGYFIPEKMNIVLMHEYASKLERNFPRPKEFLPERWLGDKDDDLHYSHSHPLTCSPFGFGARMCIGHRIAELKIELFVSRLIEAFDIEWFGAAPKRKAYKQLNYILGPYNFVFRDVNTKNINLSTTST